MPEEKPAPNNSNIKTDSTIALQFLDTVDSKRALYRKRGGGYEDIVLVETSDETFEGLSRVVELDSRKFATLKRPEKHKLNLDLKPSDIDELVNTTLWRQGIVEANQAIDENSKQAVVNAVSAAIAARVRAALD